MKDMKIVLISTNVLNKFRAIIRRMVKVSHMCSRFLLRSPDGPMRSFQRHHEHVRDERMVSR